MSHGSITIEYSLKTFKLMKNPFENQRKSNIAIKKIMELSLDLDIELLKSSLNKIRSHQLGYGVCDSIPVNANPDLIGAKLDQLELMLKIAENSKKILKIQFQIAKEENNKKQKKS